VKFREIRLENFKCYADAELRLDEGVTVIHGVNGSGKSSLLEACFFALYGSKALDDRTLDDVITNGAEDAEIELAFDHGGEAYHIERRIRFSGERAQTAKCVLEAPDETIEGARAVRGYVADLLRMDAEAFVNCAYVRQGEVNKLIHASPSDRQDMIDDLLQLGKLEEYRERASEARLAVKDVLSELRGNVDEIDSQIEAKEEKGLHEQLNELESERNETTAEIERIEDQLDTARETKESAESVLEEFEEKRDEIDELADDVEELEETIRETEAERDRLKERLAETRERRDDLRDERDELLAAAQDAGDIDAEDSASGGDSGADGEGALATAVEDALGQIREADERLQEELNDLSGEIQKHASEAENARERADELEATAAEKREEADELEADLDDDESTLAERREKLDAIDDEIEAAKDRFEDAPVAFGEAEAHREGLRERKNALEDDLGDVRAELRTVRSQIEEAEELLDEGKCPECGQPVEDSPHVDALADDRERLADLENERDELKDEIEDVETDLETADELVEAEREVDQLRENRSSVEQLIDEREAALEDRRERVERLREEADEHEADAESKREDAAAAEDRADERRERIAEINAERGDLRERRERLESLADAIDELADAEADIEDLRDKRAAKADLNDERRDRLSEKKERKRELEAEFDADRVEEARSEKKRAANYVEQAESTLAELREERDDLIDRIGGVRNELDELEALRERREQLVKRHDALDSLYEEAEQLQETYGDLRAELRQRNVETLERMLNETFDLVYQNDSYSHIELDGEYELTVYQKDGEPLDPEQLSGGERALFNLSLRCAIYRLLAEGIEGAAPMPPLILDEPTVFLDSGHVAQLVELVGSMRDLGVEQIVVVSHDEELVGAADAVVHVRKDPTTNRSTVERGETPALLAE